MPRYRLTIAYQGTDFCGWQKQEPPAPAQDEPLTTAMAAAAPSPTRPGRLILRTVQGVVEQAVRQVVREPVELTGASRTDSGVHALGQVAAFTCSGEGASFGIGWPESRSIESLRRAINGKLPADVIITQISLTHDSFNPISDCQSKAYSYTLLVSRDRPLWDRHFVHQVWEPLQLDLMQQAAEQLVGEHDFASFAAAGHGRLSTVRTILSCKVHQHAENRMQIVVSGTGFLYNTVRIIAGTLIEVGKNRIHPSDIPKIIEAKDRTRAGPTLPPTGLRLEWIKYPQP